MMLQVRDPPGANCLLGLGKKPVTQHPVRTLSGRGTVPEISLGL
jgi:hypothetical protein